MNRPQILYNAAMSLDGRTATKGGDSTLSDELDWKEVHNLRRQADAIMVGISTVLKDDSKLTIKTEEKLVKYPSRIVVDSSCRTPPKASVIQAQKSIYPTIIVCTAQSPAEKRHLLEQEGATVLVAGEGPRVDLEAMLSVLYDLGIRSVLLEGGGTLAWGFLERDLIDEIRVFIAPTVSGGRNSTSLFMGEGFALMTECPKFCLSNVSRRDSHIIAQYSRARDI